MSFIGIIADDKSYQFIKRKISQIKNIEVIKITNKNIENIKNITFEMIIICNEIKKMDNIVFLNTIIEKAQYLVINSDINKELGINIQSKINIITFGLNQKASVTISSIKENEIMICLQRSLKDVNAKLIEPQEINVKEKDISNRSIYNILVLFIINQVYNMKN